MTRWSLAFLVAIPLLAQTAAELFEKAPPAVDEALRARIKLFYQAHLDGKFRLADQVVAEDSKDAFFSAEKTRYRGFEIARIVYEDNFTRARAVVAVDTEFVAVGMGRVPVKMPLTTLWKVVDGQWFWYVDPEAGKQTPFGPMKPGAEGGGASPLPSAPPDARALLNLVRADRSEVRLSSYEPSSGEVTITNGMPGRVTLALEYNGFRGLEVELDRTELDAKQTARLMLRCRPADKAPKPTVTVTVRVQPSGQAIPVRVTFAVPPEG
ncbi:MAG: hypothetical protein AAB225_07420 [Acidobacteriota bacterium]